MAQVHVGWWVRLGLRPSGVGFLVAITVLALLYGPGFLAGALGPANVANPVFPSTIARYSWFTGMLSSGRIATATLLYQNGVGVEFMDTPQSVLLSADGSTYRRLDEAESLSIAEDQGDPAISVLSPDGTFVVIGSAGRTGEVRVVRLHDGHNRAVDVGAGRTALPVSIGADGRSVLLATSDGVVNRYTDGNNLGLARLDIETGRLRDYPAVTNVYGAALSPDGSRIVVTSSRGAKLIDAATGRVTATFEASSEVSLDGDAWSPDGTMIALVDGASVAVVDVTDRPVARRLSLTGMTYGSAVGWRDESTVLVHGVTDSSANTSELYWVDVATGKQTSVASYTPNFTGAALVGPDAARNLIPMWRIEPRTVDRGPFPLVLGLLLAVILGLAGAGTTTIIRRYRATTDLP